MLRVQRSSIREMWWVWITLVLVLHLYIATTALWTPNSEDALVRLPQVIALAVLLLLVPPIFLERPEASMNWLLKLCFWTSLVYAAGGIFGPRSWWEGTRMAAFEGGPNVFVRIMATGIISATYLWRRTSRARWLAPLPLLLICGVMSGSRGGLIAMIFGCSLYWLLTLPAARKKLRAAVCCVLSLPALLALVPGSFQESLAEVVQVRYVRLTFEELYLSGRGETWGAAWKSFVAHPFFGVGLNGQEAISGYPHNIILNILSEGGLIGFVLLVMTFFLLVPRWFRARALEHTTAFALGVLYLVANCFSGTYYDYRFMWLFFLLYLIPATGIPPRTFADSKERQRRGSVETPALSKLSQAMPTEPG